MSLRILHQRITAIDDRQRFDILCAKQSRRLERREERRCRHLEEKERVKKRFEETMSVLFKNIYQDGVMAMLCRCRL